MMKSFREKNLCLMLSFFTLLFLCITAPVTAKSSYKIPSNINSSTKYLFHMHGRIVEVLGPRAIHPKHKEWGPHDYYGILKSFEEKGFTVISDKRPEGTKLLKYSKKVAKQVIALLEAGVPPENITVSGFSKGGTMTLIVATLLKNPNIKYVVLAGCCSNLPNPKFKKIYREHVLSRCQALQGRFLSIYDTVDDQCQTCETEFKMAAPETINSTEIKLTTGLGHGLFWTTREEWLEPMFSWINQSKL
jgi:hypothetical protein